MLFAVAITTIMETIILSPIAITTILITTITTLVFVPRSNIKSDYIFYGIYTGVADYDVETVTESCFCVNILDSAQVYINTINSSAFCNYYPSPF